MTGRGVAVTGARRGHPVPDDVADDSVLDHLDALLRRPLEVERLREVRAVERVVCDRDLRVEGLLADPAAEVAPLLEVALRAHRVVGEPADELGNREGLEDGGVRAGLELLRAACPRSGLRRLAGGLRRIDVADAPARALRPTGGIVGRGEADADRVRHRLCRAEAGGRCDRELRDAAREVAVEAEVWRGLDRRAGQTRLVLGAERRRLFVVAADVLVFGRRREAREVRVGPGAVRSLAGAARNLGEAVGITAVRGRPADLAVSDDADPHDGVVDQRRLVDDRRREPRDAGTLGVDEDLCLVPLGGPKSLLG